MTRYRPLLAGTLALCTLSLASPAAAQFENLTPSERSATARYALPAIFDVYVRQCSSELQPGGYVNSNARALRAKFSRGVDAAWPVAKRALTKMRPADGDFEGIAAMLAVMPDEQLRPFVDGLIGASLAPQIKREDCGTVERGLEILDPLPAENVAELIGFTLELEARNRKRETEAARPGK